MAKKGKKRKKKEEIWYTKDRKIEK